MVPVEMPKLGNTVEECLVARWFKKKGDAVSKGEVVVEIETDKTSFEIEAPTDGILLETFFETGALVPVFTTLFVIGNPGENAETFRSKNSPASDVLVACAQEPTGDTARSKSRTDAAARSDILPGTAAPLSPRARRFAEEHNFHPGVI